MRKRTVNDRSLQNLRKGIRIVTSWEGALPSAARPRFRREVDSLMEGLPAEVRDSVERLVYTRFLASSVGNDIRRGKASNTRLYSELMAVITSLESELQLSPKQKRLAGTADKETISTYLQEIGIPHMRKLTPPPASWPDYEAKTVAAIEGRRREMESADNPVLGDPELASVEDGDAE